MKDILKYIPGFRTDKKWKKIIAIIYYLFCILESFQGGFSGFLLLVSIPFIIHSIVEFIKYRNKTAILTFIASIIIFGVAVNIKNVAYDNAYTATEEVKPVEVVTPVVTLTAEQIATNKKIADAQAIEDKKVADAQIAKEAKEKQDIINKNTKNLSSGEYNISTHLSAGVYDVTFNGTGNFNVYDKDGKLLTNEVGGGADIGISKYRAILTEGCKIKIAGMSINTLPVEKKLSAYAEMSLYAGYWTVGEDVTSGRYKVSTARGNGNFMIFGSDGMPKTNEILGSSGVKEILVNLEDNDIIQISSLNHVKFTPSE